MLTKRKKFVLTSVILGLGFLGLQFIDNQYKFYLIGVLCLLTLGLFYYSLREGLSRNATLLVLILPVMYTLGVAIFWFLLPATILARLPVIIIYSIGIYALCLTSNIYTVSAIRTIALLRAARGVGFVLTLLTSFLIYDAILSLRIAFWFSSLLIGFASFPLFLQGLWTIPLSSSIKRETLVSSGIFSVAMAEIAIALHFWPTTVVVGSLFLTIAVYMLLGLGQVKAEGRLFPKTIREYLTIGVVVFIGMFLVTSWAG